MRQYPWFFFVLELLVACACLYLGFEARMLNAFVICALVCACLLVTKLLLEMLKGPQWLTWLCALSCVLALSFYRADVLLPLAVVLLCDILSKNIEPPLTNLTSSHVL